MNAQDLLPSVVGLYSVQIAQLLAAGLSLTQADRLAHRLQSRDTEPKPETADVAAPSVHQTPRKD